MKTIDEIIHYCKPFYKQENRYYHNWSHIQYMINTLDFWIKNKLLLMDESKQLQYKLAIYFHDIVYDIHQYDTINIQQSIELYLNFNNYENNLQNQIIELIKATDYSILLAKKSVEQRIMTDLDLSILASSHHMYQKYCKNIRKEYAIYSNYDFIKGRRKLMCRLYDLASTNQLFMIVPEYNKNAVINIKNELKELEI